uniref:Uncharacterized protein n=1 Tax=Romanomermis culicivorax TaxID=13658 RepID=A0A915KQZ8_ROMCU
MVAMMASIRGGSRWLLVVATIAIVLAIAVVVITMGVTGIVMAIETNRERVAIATVVGGIAAAGKQSRGSSCIAINNGRAEGNPVGGSGPGGNKFHRAEKSCRCSRGMGQSVLL